MFNENPTVFHWHGETFDIPKSFINMVSSEANQNQAFYFNKNIIGLQFHLEATPATTYLMLENGFQELTENPYIQMKEQIKKGIVVA